ncbi:NAD(P)H-hydrate dehydratase [Rhodoferax sp.]|uniref:NAD(P)H-hydrate dehydratase n=1 Tax=Rhodoferax sp. TaxID=50421 RepID=UPI00260F1149|nr:NAD(P)H-hydrate dehydratase [Rhodoferax sp.]MDD2808474.1 NAD(P)H-hydrate dehydratase [Rhodoferax sp.]
MRKILAGFNEPLYGVQATRLIEAACQASIPQPSLMERAGLASAKLVLAVAPHAQRIWVACGPGNNGGDGLEAALHLKQWGKQPLVTWLGHADTAPADAASAYQRAHAAGVQISTQLPDQVDVVLDALLGLGTQLREPSGDLAHAVQRMLACAAPVVAIDLPTGLSADSGAVSQLHVKAHHTLCVLTLKPGCFTAQGKDACGTVWLDDLGAGELMRPMAAAMPSPDAMLAAAPALQARPHASHKGSFGDVAIIGGAPGMTGAALLAARAALYGGAGRVFVSLLDAMHPGVDMSQPELMFRLVEQLDFSTTTLVCGCGGGAAVAALLPKVLASASPVVLDADALNTLALQPVLQRLLAKRAAQGQTTVLTPHPLEAARLLACSAPDIQANRLQAARELCAMFNCTVVLKGSGTVIASPGHTPVINPTGNAKLATGGTGDVLAGMVGARLAAGQNAFHAACHAVYQHGLAADRWPALQPLTAAALAKHAS